MNSDLPGEMAVVGRVVSVWLVTLLFLCYPRGFVTPEGHYTGLIASVARILEQIQE